MKVKELIEKLQDLNPELDVLDSDDWPIWDVEEMFWSEEGECSIPLLECEDGEEANMVSIHSGN